METIIEVRPCGQKIETIYNTNGFITAIDIRFKSISYEVTYFVEQEKKTVWLDEEEINDKITDTQKIGFKS